MTKLRKIVFGFLGAFILTALPMAQAQNVPGPDGSVPKMHSEQRIQEIYNQLNLTDVQKQQLEANKKQHRARMENARQELKTDKEALKAELMKPQLDMNKINELHNQVKTLLSQMEDNKLSSILAVRSILTPEQFTAFVDLMHRHKPEHQE